MEAQTPFLFGLSIGFVLGQVALAFVARRVLRKRESWAEKGF